MKAGLKDFLAFMETNEGKLTFKKRAEDVAQVMLSTMKLLVDFGGFLFRSLKGAQAVVSAVKISINSILVLIAKLEKRVQNLDISKFVPKFLQNSAVKFGFIQSEKAREENLKRLNKLIKEGNAAIEEQVNKIADLGDSYIEGSETAEKLSKFIAGLKDSAESTTEPIKDVTAAVDEFNKKLQEQKDLEFRAKIEKFSGKDSNELISNVRRLDDGFQKLNKNAKLFGDTLTETIDSLVFKTGSLRETLKGLLQDFTRSFFSQNFSQPFGAAVTTGLSNIFAGPPGISVPRSAVPAPLPDPVGAASITQNFNISTPNVSSFNRSQSSIFREANRGLSTV